MVAATPTQPKYTPPQLHTDTSSVTADTKAAFDQMYSGEFQTPNDIATQIEIAMLAGTRVCVWGDPGIGKSGLAKTLAVTHAFESHIDIRAPLYDPVDLRGIPVRFTMPDGTEVTKWLTPEELPRSGRHFIVLEELNRAEIGVQNALFQMIGDGRIGQWFVPKECFLMACCNIEDIGVMPFSDALASRFGHLFMRADRTQWLEWAFINNIHVLVRAFIKSAAGQDQFYKRLVGEKGEPNPRTWENVSKNLYAMEKLRAQGKTISRNVAALNYAGWVGKTAATQFLAFEDLAASLPELDDIIKDPLTCLVPRNNSARYLLVMMMAKNANKKNFDALTRYLFREDAGFSREFEMLFMYESMANNDEIAVTKSFMSWAQDPRNTSLAQKIRAL